MKKIILNINKFSNDEIEFIADNIRCGKIIIIPTDTVYGLSALARNKKSVDRIYKIKKREKGKPLILLMKSFCMIRKYCFLNKRQYTYMQKELKKGKPVTFVLKSKDKKLNYLSNDEGGLSVRIPKKSYFLMKLLKKINEPIVSTSLNLSGNPVLEDLTNLEKKIQGKYIDIGVDIGKTKRSKSSRLVNIVDMNSIKIVRK